MGWTYTNKGTKTAKQFMDAEFTSDKVRVLDSAVVGRTEYYAAVEVITNGKPEVVAVCAKLEYRPKDYYSFGYKDMDENMGPYMYQCPARILDRLSPTTNEYALKWRAANRQAVAQRASVPKVQDGTIVKFNTPIRFTTGETLDTFKVFKNGAKVRFGYVGSTFPAFRITRWQDRPFTVVG